jgi:hypothetical protein
VKTFAERGRLAHTGVRTSTLKHSVAGETSLPRGAVMDSSHTQELTVPSHTAVEDLALGTGGRAHLKVQVDFFPPSIFY